MISTPTGPAGATTGCFDAQGQQVGPAAYCTILISAGDHATAASIATTVAHGVSAYQAVMAGTLANCSRQFELAKRRIGNVGGVRPGR